MDWNLVFGMVLGWLTAPYVLVLGVWFFLMFPVISWGIDIYEGDRQSYRFVPTILLMLLTAGALPFFTSFEVAWLLTGEFWSSASGILLYIVGYFAVGIFYALIVRWPFYVKKFYSRILDGLGDSPSQKSIDDAFAKHRLDKKGSRLRLIVRWIFYWPWSLIIWVVGDFLGDIVDFFFRSLRSVVGGRFRDVALWLEPKEFKKARLRAERKQQESSSQ